MTGRAWLRAAPVSLPALLYPLLSFMPHVNENEPDYCGALSTDSKVWRDYIHYLL